MALHFFLGRGLGALDFLDALEVLGGKNKMVATLVCCDHFVESRNDRVRTDDLRNVTAAL